MNYEAARIAQALPYMAAARARNVIQEEIYKGCRPELSPCPVSLEPAFFPLWKQREGMDRDAPLLSYSKGHAVSPEHLIRLKVWMSPDQPLDWILHELFLKQLQALSSRAALEIYGNSDAIVVGFLCHQADLPILQAAFLGEFGLCGLTPLEARGLSAPLCFTEKWDNFYFRDYFPYPPYSHLLTRPSELSVSPLQSLLFSMKSLKPPVFGIYQVLFQPVPPEHNWHQNVQILLDYEYFIKLQGSPQLTQRYAQQGPSGDLRQMSMEVESKAHNDKPFFSMALRIGVANAGEEAGQLLSALCTFTGLFQHGGRPLRYVNEEDYRKILSPEGIREIFLLRVVHRPGFLVNSNELYGPVHVFSMKAVEEYAPPIEGLDPLRVTNECLLSGTRLGTCSSAGTCQDVCIPPDIRKRHTHIIGSSGMGKTSVQEQMILYDIEQGHGVAVLDPHGDLAERILGLIPENCVERTIYFNPGISQWVPIWNPLKAIPGQDPGRMTEDIVMAIKSFVSSGGWGDRLEFILRNIILSLIQLEQGTFLDISRLLRNHAHGNKVLIDRILQVVGTEETRRFWEYDYDKYKKDDLGPPKNKLGKMLSSGSVALMLSQPESRFDFRTIMDEGKILIINLTGLPTNIRQVLGCFILSMLHLTALSRSNLPLEKRRQFHIHCDEVHRFMTDALEDLVAETRKYSVSLTLCHQYLSQFEKSKQDAFSTMGSTIIFNVDGSDARYLIKDLRNLVKVDDLLKLRIGEVVARIGTDVVRFKTLPPRPLPEINYRQRIMDESFKKYYRPAHEIQKLIMENGKEAPRRVFIPISTDEPLKEFVYDEF